MESKSRVAFVRMRAVPLRVAVGPRNADCLCLRSLRVAAGCLG